MNPPTFEVLLVDPEELSKFLYSCAYTAVLAGDMKLVSESTGLLWGLGHALGMPGGSARRVSETLKPSQRKVLAIESYNSLLAQYRELLDKPKAQLKFLIDLQIKRDKERLAIDNMFAQVRFENERIDAILTEGAKYFNNVQAVATIALAVMAPAAGAANAGRVFVYILGTKTVIAVAQSEHSWSNLFGFAIGTFKDGVLALGELSGKAFELIRDVAIEDSRNRMAIATARYLSEMAETTRRIATLQANIWSTQRSLLSAKKGSDNARYLEALIKNQNAEMQAAKAQMARLGSQAVGASRTGQFMKNFGGKAVPLVCVAIDTALEYQRWWEVNNQLEDRRAAGRR